MDTSWVDINFRSFKTLYNHANFHKLVIYLNFTNEESEAKTYN